MIITRFHLFKDDIASRGFTICGTEKQVEFAKPANDLGPCSSQPRTTTFSASGHVGELVVLRARCTWVQIAPGVVVHDPPQRHILRPAHLRHLPIEGPEAPDWPHI